MSSAQNKYVFELKERRKRSGMGEDREKEKR
jgi:hypothetical protein